MEKMVKCGFNGDIAKPSFLHVLFLKKILENKLGLCLVADLPFQWEETWLVGALLI